MFDHDWRGSFSQRGKIEQIAGRASSNDIDDVLIEEHDLSSGLLSQLSTLHHSQ